MSKEMTATSNIQIQIFFDHSECHYFHCCSTPYEHEMPSHYQWRNYIIEAINRGHFNSWDYPKRKFCFLAVSQVMILICNDRNNPNKLLKSLPVKQIFNKPSNRHNVSNNNNECRRLETDGRFWLNYQKKKNKRWSEKNKMAFIGYKSHKNMLQ